MDLELILGSNPNFDRLNRFYFTAASITGGRSYGEHFYRLHCGILNYSAISARIDVIKCGMWVS